MTVTDTTGLDTAVATYVSELSDPARRAELVETLAQRRPDRDRLYGGTDQRVGTALDLLAPFLDRTAPHDRPDRPADPVGPRGRDPRFVGWARTLVGAWLRGEHADLRAHPLLADAEQLHAQHVEDQVALVSETLVRTLLEVLAERRLAGALTGGTPETRFDDFRAWIGSPEGATYLARTYPAAVIRAHALVARRSRSVREILDRFDADLPDLRCVLPAMHDDVRIHAIELGAGDTHGEGRTVAILDLGDDGRLVYKPRNLAADRAFRGLAEGLNAALGTSLRVPRTLARAHHGWCEFIDGAGATTDTADYPRRLGELTAVAYLLRSTDLHYENVVTDAAGRPVVVDAETIMTARPVRAPSYADGAGSSRVRRLLEESVLGIGLLPLRVSVPGRDASLDIGAAGSVTQGQETPFRSLGVRHVGRDDMHVALEPGRAGSGNANANAGPGLDAVVEFRDGIRRGFEETLRRLRDHRDVVHALLRDEFADARLRHVNIPTVFYSQLLRMCSHPRLLEDPDGHLAVLGRVSLRNEAALSAAGHEVDQMLRDDVPLFTVHAGGTDLLDHEGRTLVAGYFEHTPLDGALERLRTLDEDEIERQVELVNVAFVPRLPDGGERTLPLAPPTGPTAVRPTRRNALDAAAATAVERILSRWVPATVDQHPGTFWGPVVTTSDAAQWTPGSLGYDVYGGSLGIALALAEAGHLLDLPAAREAAVGVVAPVRAQILAGAFEGHGVSVGAMTGMGGTVWAVAATDRLLGTGTREHPRLVDALTAAIHPGALPELTSGLAGALATGCGVVERADPADRRAADEALARLAHAVLPGLESGGGEAGPAGRARTADGVPSPVFTGYAHGLAGLVAPVYRAARLLSASEPDLAGRLRAVGSPLLEVLLGQIAPDGALPRTVGGTDASWAWCHGAPGVLLGLLDAAAAGAAVPERVLLALGDRTQERGIGNNPTYCHGDLGSLEALHRLAVHTRDDSLRRRWAAEVAARAATTAAREHGSARDRYAGSDSLMVGRAGALHALLRTQDPHSCPDVLTQG